MAIWTALTALDRILSQLSAVSPSVRKNAEEAVNPHLTHPEQFIADAAQKTLSTIQSRKVAAIKASSADSYAALMTDKVNGVINRIEEQDRVGGINLDPALLDLQIKRDGNGIVLPLDQQPADMKIEGVLPVIIDVRPINLPLLLGLTDDKPPTKDIIGSQPNAVMDRLQLRWRESRRQPMSKIL